MAWIALHQTVWSHRKTLMLASELGVESDLAAAKMSRLWHWCLDNAPDGDLSALPPSVIAFGANWAGDPAQWIRAMVTAGYAEGEDGRLVLHDWWDYAGRLMQKRREDADRKRAARSCADAAGTSTEPAPAPAVPSPGAPSSPSPSVQRTSAGHPPPVQLPSAVCPPDVQRNSTVQHRTAEYSTGENDDGGGAGTPLSLDSRDPDLLAALLDILPAARRRPAQERLLEKLVEDYPGVDLLYEATLCRAHHGDRPRNWAKSFAHWVTAARAVRLWNGRSAPPSEGMSSPPVAAGDESSDGMGPFVPTGHEAWDAAAHHLRSMSGSAAFTTWLAGLRVEGTGDILRLIAPSEYHREWLQSRFDGTIRRALADTGHGQLNVVYTAATGDTEVGG